MKINVLVKYIILFSAVFVSCQKEYFVKPPPDLNTPVSFSKELLPVLIAKCASGGCHDKSYPPKLLADFAYSSLMEGGYIDTMAPANSKLMIRLNKDMPKGKLPQAEINKFLSWITQGAKEN